MLTAEQDEIRAPAHDFAGKVMRARAIEWEREAAVGREAMATMGELGFFGMLVPQAHGGLSLDIVTYLAVLEELAWGDAATALLVANHSGRVSGALLTHGSAFQRDAWLPRLASGEILGTCGPHDGVDGRREGSCSAERRAGGWCLSGERVTVLTGGRDDIVALLPARSSGNPGAGLFLVDPAGGGCTVARRPAAMGLRAAGYVELHLDRVPADPIEGEGEGAHGGRFVDDLARLGVAAVAIGIARAALERGAGYAREREQFGRPIADFDATRGKVAKMAGGVEAARSLTLEAGARLEAERSGETPRGRVHGAAGTSALVAMAKVAAADAASRVADEAVQLFGGYGCMKEYPVERLWRDAKGTQIHEGTTDALRLIVAREIIGV
jgi:alkylation response protein AidB-like acyl-CoA dehydrogenase